ncbi:GIY-YIG nuclease family protein [Negadavirga shengliensis]|uniref:GIY-YIG nuclease family protein n=1 Tax=Negadavirga shengliensis TaxID=1389218 RepID=A0ABV9SXB6_9BACT
MEYFVYILESEVDGTYYVGVSEDPDKRLKKHNLPHKGFTGRKRPWKIVYVEKFPGKTQALNREKFIKAQKSRVFIQSLIAATGLK